MTVAELGDHSQLNADDSRSYFTDLIDKLAQCRGWDLETE